VCFGKSPFRSRNLAATGYKENEPGHQGIPYFAGGSPMFDAVAKNTLVPLILRFALAVIFIYHGLGKVNQATDWGAAWMKPPPVQAEGPKPASEEAKPKPEVPPVPPAPIQMAVAWGELVGGIALAVGFLTRLAALGLAVIMAGAIYTVHWPHGFSLQNHGYEYNFAILALCVPLMLIGGGPLAVDRVFRLRRRKAGE
jgi:uncharacterized membrane protein YphA (DoxX/SURF4 family)